MRLEISVCFLLLLFFFSASRHEGYRLQVTLGCSFSVENKRYIIEEKGN